LFSCSSPYLVFEVLSCGPLDGAAFPFSLHDRLARKHGRNYQRPPNFFLSQAYKLEFDDGGPLETD
jgi:hypothetical protein